MSKTYIYSEHKKHIILEVDTSKTQEAINEILRVKPHLPLAFCFSSNVATLNRTLVNVPFKIFACSVEEFLAYLRLDDLLSGEAKRDPQRIDVILEELRKFWVKRPDWRLGQIIVNLVRAQSTSDIFYLEDDMLLQRLREWKDEKSDTEGGD